MKAITVTVAAFALSVFVASVSQGVEGSHVAGHAPPPGGETLSMSKFYTGIIPGEVGTFPGKLVCLGCDLVHGAGAAAGCKTLGHRHALSMDDGMMIHPLVAGTEEVLQQINSGELHGKKVKTSGIHYPSTGVIFVNQIAVME